jgi:hypothetical protein
VKKETAYKDGDFINHKHMIGERVEKHTGDYTTFGEVRGIYVTKHGKLRYVVEVEPQGFQMIWSEKELRAAPLQPAPSGAAITINEVGDDA